MDISPTGKQNSLPIGREDTARAASQAQAQQQQPQDNAQKAASKVPTKPFESPVVQIDSATGSTVLSFRDANNGQEQFQSPSRTALEYNRAQRVADHQKAEHSDPLTA